jgi:hypothetical protein
LYGEHRLGWIPVKNGQAKLTGRQPADRNSEAIFWMDAL